MNVKIVSDVGELEGFLRPGGDLPSDDDYSSIFHALESSLVSNYVFASSPPYEGAGIIGDEYCVSGRQINLVVESAAQDKYLIGRIFEFLASKAPDYSVLLDIRDAQSRGGQVWIVVRSSEDILAWASHSTGQGILQRIGLID